MLHIFIVSVSLLSCHTVLFSGLLNSVTLSEITANHLSTQEKHFASRFNQWRLLKYAVIAEE
jgi:hypothetical protein